ncbi:MAG TPA: S41 family peptidase [Ignavibacteriaceae bacterium]|nr:S41 family peptidase [Ignavibacteriaceae bacterium]
MKTGNNKTRLIWVFVLVPALMGILALNLVRKDIYFDVAKNIDIFTRVFKEIAFNYVDDISPEEFLRAGIRGMLSTLDPYTVFVDEKRKDDVDLLTTGKYGGVGISIGIRDEHVTIVELLSGYAAQKQGIIIGDVILKVDSVLISPAVFEEISSHVKGKPGTFVSITILRNSRDTLIFNLLREEIIVKNVEYAGFYPESSKNAYVRLSGFGRTSGEELKKAITELRKKSEIETLVLDLRGNPGGLLDAAVDIAGKFLDKNLLVVSTKGRDTTNVKQYFNTQEPLLKDIKIALLVDGSSASASEIVAGAVQDHDRGIILGTATFGKGLVQTITPLSYNTSLKITTSKYYTPSGRCIQKIDYSGKNPVFKSVEENKKAEFLTDNKRIVFSSGGITPDSIMDFTEKSEILLELYAKGLIFQFANEFYEKNNKTDFSKITDEVLFNEFSAFLHKQNFELKGEAFRIISNLEDEIATLNGKNALKKEISVIRDELTRLYSEELGKQKSGLLREIKNELAKRYFSPDKSFEMALGNDILINKALEFLRNSETYNKLLKSN